MGYQTLACAESFAGASFRAMEDEVQKKVDAYATMLFPSNEDFENDGVILSSNYFYNLQFPTTKQFPIIFTTYNFQLQRVKIM